MTLWVPDRKPATNEASTAWHPARIVMLKRQTAFSMPHHASPPSPLTTRVRMGLVQHTDTGAGPALLALHGGMGGYDQSWLLARALIADLTPYRVLALSRPGYLGTAQSLGRTPDAQADLYAELLDALGIEKALVAAVSAGGPSAIQFALRHPGRCAGLVLVSTATGPLETAPAFLKRLQKMVWINRVPGLVALMRRRLMENPLSGATRSIGDPDLAARTLAHPIAGPLFLATQRSSLSQVSRRLPGTLVDTKYFQAMPKPPYDRIFAPVLSIHGDADPVVPISHSTQLVDATPHARRVILAGGGHMALFSHLDEVRAGTVDFTGHCGR
jgi:pimeloyl-ACP methyl ester carboxylesterase